MISGFSVFMGLTRESKVVNPFPLGGNGRNLTGDPGKTAATDIHICRWASDKPGRLAYGYVMRPALPLLSSVTVDQAGTAGGF